MPGTTGPTSTMGKIIKFPGQPTRSRPQLPDGPLAPMRRHGPRRSPAAGSRGQFAAAPLVLAPSPRRTVHGRSNRRGAEASLTVSLAYRLASPSAPLPCFPLCSLADPRPPPSGALAPASSNPHAVAAPRHPGNRLTLSVPRNTSRIPSTAQSSSGNRRLILGAMIRALFLDE